MLDYADHYEFLNDQGHLPACEEQDDKNPCICLELLEAQQELEDDIAIETELEKEAVDIDILMGEKV